MNNSFSLIFIFFLIIVACKKPPITTLDAEKEKIKNFQVQEINFTYLTAKAKINFKDSENDINAGVNIRIKKDSIIWVSLVPLLGIEASRCLITKDSIFLLDRLNNHYYEYDYTSLEKKINIRLNYKILESMILGNLPYTKSEKDQLSILPNEDYYLLHQNHGNINIENYVKISSMKLERLQLKETQKELHIVYNNFAPLNDFLFAYNSLINLTYPHHSGIQSTKISIQYNKVELTDKILNFPFNVPAKYSKNQ